MNKKELSEKQWEILNYIKSYILEHGYPPVVREICEEVHLKSTSSVKRHLDILEEAGYIRKNSSKFRSIELADDEINPLRAEVRNIPMVGEVAAGSPILAEQNITGYFPFLSEELPSGDLFLLSVRGESMIQAGIFDGDRILVRQTSTASNGDIVVALVDDSATVKTFYKEKDCFRLQPENDAMDPIYVTELTILGVVVGLFRFM